MTASTIVPLLSLLYVVGFMSRFAAHIISDDLHNIGTFYSEAGCGKGSQYFVAEELDHESGASSIVGTVALQHKDAGTAELKRMSVSKSVRGGGVGRLLALTLVEHARTVGFEKVVLTTTSAQYSALRLYGRLGYVAHSIGDDLSDIGKFYSAAGYGKGSNYFVAEEFKNGTSTIVGTVALQQKDAHTGELRRMSVSKSMRGAGVGRLLGNSLIEYAKDVGFTKVVLTTTSAQYSALRLYAKLGWVTVGSEMYSGMRMMRLELDVEGREPQAGAGGSGGEAGRVGKKQA
ncbi:MAG: hypothetical protein WDW38_002405 [Sanguina aurantia]